MEGPSSVTHGRRPTGRPVVPGRDGPDRPTVPVHVAADRPAGVARDGVEVPGRVDATVGGPALLADARTVGLPDGAGE